MMAHASTRACPRHVRTCRDGGCGVDEEEVQETDANDASSFEGATGSVRRSVA